MKLRFFASLAPPSSSLAPPTSSLRSVAALLLHTPPPSSSLSVPLRLFFLAQVIPHIGAKPEQERVISYLPLSHVAGMMVDIVMPMCITADKPGWVTTSYARPYDLKASSIGDRLKSVKPTIFLGVRIWWK